MRVYKVVKRREGRLFSAVVEGRAEVEYKKGVWTTPPRWLEEKGYLLTAFRSLEQAIKFYHVNQFSLFKRLGQSPPPGSLEIWEAEVGEGEWKVVQLPQLDFFLLGKGKISIWGEENEWPPGTIMAKRIRLLKKVY